MRLLQQAEAAMGQLDVLVANAGVTRDNLFVQLRDEDWDRVIAVNLSATFRLRAQCGARNDAPPLRPHHRHYVGCGQRPGIPDKPITWRPKPASPE